MSIGYPLRVDNPDKLDCLTVTRFNTEKRSNCFFDSIVAINKGKRAFPKFEIRLPDDRPVFQRLLRQVST